MTSSTPPASGRPTAVFRHEAGLWQATELSRGPWDPRAQHGGAPSALLAHLAESAMPEPGWQLARLSVELIRPVPVGVLGTRCSSQPARSTTRVTIDLLAGDTLVARAHALMLRSQTLSLPDGLRELPGLSPQQLLPLPRDCSGPLRIPGTPAGITFHGHAVDTRMAQGDGSQPGPGAAWFRLAVPLVDGVANSPAMRAAAAADFGNGVGWVLPMDRYLFSNADLSLHLHRQPVGEWVGLASETQVDGSGAGTAFSRLYDEQGLIGVAVQTLVLRERTAP